MELGSIALMKKILTAEKSKVISCSFIMYIVDQKRGPRLADMEKMRTRQTMCWFLKHLLTFCWPKWLTYPSLKSMVEKYYPPWRGGHIPRDHDLYYTTNSCEIVQSTLRFSKKKRKKPHQGSLHQ